MLKPLLLAAAAALAGSAQAAPSLREFSFTGFFHQESASFLPDATLSGSVESEDGNRNGVIERDEVSSFILDDLEYLGRCLQWYCELREFSYVPGGALHFLAEWTEEPSRRYFMNSSVRSGDYAMKYYSWPTGSATRTYLWTGQTRFLISPVPEPAMASLLVPGLAALGLAWRGRRRAG